MNTLACRMASIDGRFVSARIYLAYRVLIDPQGCWLWRLADSGNGYGIAFWRGQRRKAHVFAWEAWNGSVPPGKQINHRCHVRACCNPDHLYAGTMKENTRDMLIAGRGPDLSGEKNGRARLTKENVREIRNSREPTKALVSRFGVCETVVRAIRRGEGWREVA